MKTYFIIIISGLMVIFGLLLYPTIRTIVAAQSTTNELPITTAARYLVPLALLGFVIYGINRLRK
jgi:hypothetical protein